MTISATTVVTRTNTNGSTHTFNFAYPFADPDDLTVYLVNSTTGVATLQVKDTDYTVSNTGSEPVSGGSITFIDSLGANEAPASGSVCVILRDPDLIQDFNPSGRWPSQQGEDALDRIYQILQLNDWRIGRTIHQSDLEAASDLELPLIADRAGKALIFDAQGDVTVGDTAADIATAAAASATAASTSAAAAAVSASAAETSANAAAASATAASGSATAASSSATAAAASETAAASSATSASNSAATATSEASNASASASAAATSETNASNSASSASTSASTATTQATNASNSASAASTSASNAATSATAAQTAETNAETAETNAEAAQGYAEEWAINPEDDPVSVAAGGDNSTTFSALHWAAKAAASAATLTTEALQDIVGGMFSGNTETGVTVTYQDSDGTIDVEVNGVLEDLHTLGPATTDGEFLVATGAGAFAWESGATARASLGLTIGTHVQAYSSILANTTASFTTADETKVDYLTVTGATDLDTIRTKVAHLTVTQAVDLDAIEARVNQLDASVVLSGTWDASSGSFPGGGTAQAGQSYIVSVGGTVDSVAFTANDRIVAITDNASTSTYASNWHKLDYTDAVLSVAGRTGAVTLAVADITDMSSNGRSLVAAADYAAMKALLDLEIGTDVQAYSANLAEWSGINPSANGASLVSAADYAAMKALLDLEIGTDVQAYSANLSATGSTTIKLVGPETIWVPAKGMTARTTNGAASGTTESTTNDVVYPTFDFDQSTEEGVGFWIAMPKSWNESTVTFIPYWTAASGSGGVVFAINAYSFSNDDAIDTAPSGQQTSTDTLIATGDIHVGPESSAITIGGSPAEGDIVYFQITREVGDGSDTLSGDAKLIGVKVIFTTNAATDA